MGIPLVGDLASEASTILENEIELEEAAANERPKFGDLRIELLQTFLMVAEEKKQASAAYRLRKSQPNVSQDLTSLKLWLGSDFLFERRFKGYLMPDAKRLLPIAQKVVALLEEAYNYQPTADEMRAYQGASDAPAKPRVSAKNLKPPAPKVDN